MDWLQITQSLGIPAAILVGMGWGIYLAACWVGREGKEAVIWVGKEVIIPLRNQHFEFLTEMRAVSRSIDSRLTSLESGVQGVGDDVIELRSFVVRPGSGEIEVFTQQRSAGAPGVNSPIGGS